MTYVELTQWARIGLYALIGLLSYLNRYHCGALARRRNVLAGLVFLSIAFGSFLRITANEAAIKFYDPLWLTPLVVSLLFLEVLILVVRHRPTVTASHEHRRIEDK